MQRIEVPANALVALLALPGAGKSTFARTHFAPDERVSSDFCRHLVVGDEGAQWANRSAFAVFHTILRERLRHGRLSVADATHLTSRGRSNVLALAREMDAPPVLLLLDVPEEVCREQNRGRERAVPETDMDRMAIDYERALQEIRREPWTAILSVDPKRPLTLVRTASASYRELLPAPAAPGGLGERGPRPGERGVAPPPPGRGR